MDEGEKLRARLDGIEARAIASETIAAVLLQILFVSLPVSRENMLRMLDEAHASVRGERVEVRDQARRIIANLRRRYSGD